MAMGQASDRLRTTGPIEVPMHGMEQETLR